MKIELQFDDDLLGLEAYSDVDPQFSVGDQLAMTVRVGSIRPVPPVLSEDDPFWSIYLVPAGVLKPDHDGLLFLHATLETTP